MKVIWLTMGQFTMVDDEDYEWLNQWKWYASKRGEAFYAMRRPTKYGKQIHMSRLILGLSDPNLFPDHKDGASLNNQRSNLRIATRSQNNANKQCVGSSGYMGVFPVSNNKKWFARINKDGKRVYLGSFTDKKDAALAYNNAAINLHGEFANLNQI